VLPFYVAPLDGYPRVRVGVTELKDVFLLPVYPNTGEIIRFASTFVIRAA